ncbi:hypothetical protein PG990_015182 [Apiospora arundinis]
MSISKLQASLSQATNEVTVAAANINFDFCLVKYEAPKEYRPLGELLSTKRKENAEHGKSHATARRLAALFDGVCPDTPQLIKAYGERVSEISKKATDNEHKSFSSSVFGSFTGVDATSIWAAATSSKSPKTGAIHVHLLACMLASMFSATEATSIWVELVEERKKAIAAAWDQDETIPFSVLAAAVQQGIARAQLAEWDASARAWLQTADSVMEAKQTQLRLILKNVQDCVVTEEPSVYPGVITAWKSTLRTMERLISGIPQEVQDGSAILGLRAWHIYPNIIVFGSRNVEVRMNDPLVSHGGELSLCCSPSSTTPISGVSWSLSLAHLKYYGQPVQRQGVFRPDPTRISFKELLTVVLGCILTRWDVPIDPDSTWGAIKFLSLVSEPFPLVPEEPFRVTADTIRANETDFADRKQGLQLISQAAAMSLKDQERSLRPFFGLTNIVPLLRCFRNADGRIEFLRRMASKTNGLQDRNCIIQYFQADRYGGDGISYASVFPRSPVVDSDGERPAKRSKLPHSRWLNPELLNQTVTGENYCTNVNPPVYITYHGKSDFECTYLPATEARQALKFWYGASGSAAIYASCDLGMPECPLPRVTQQDLLWCMEHGLLSLEKIIQLTHDSITQTLQSLAVASDHAFGTILGPVIQVKVLETPLIFSKALKPMGDQLGGSRPQISTFTQAISTLVYMVAGHDISHEDVPKNVIGISAGDSIFVPEQLLWDPMKTGVRNSFTRILGNIGKPGCVMFFSVEQPITPPLDANFWRVADPQRFDGTAADLFQNTSMHLSFTNWERSLEGFRSSGKQDVEIALMESVLSIRERGRWIGDVDILPALRSNIIYRLPPQPLCGHSSRNEQPLTHMISIESWDELREFSAGSVVVRANGNWLARLAATAYLAQSAERDQSNIKRITVCPSSIIKRIFP